MLVYNCLICDEDNLNMSQISAALFAATISRIE